MSHEDHASRRRLGAQTFDALRIRDFRKYYVGQGVSLIGTWLQSAAVSWIVFEKTRSERMLGLVEAAGLMPGLLVALFAGAIADRMPPKTTVLLSQIGQMILAFALAVLVALGIEEIWQLALILALARICVTFEMPSRQVFLYELVGPATMANAIALNSGLFNASRILGPALAGVLLKWVGETMCFTLNGVSYLAAIAALCSITGASRSIARDSGDSGQVLGGFRYLGRDRRVATIYLLMTVFGIAGMGYSALAPSYARRLVGTEAGGYSFLLAMSGVGATAGALGVAAIGGVRRRERLVLAGIVIFSISLAAAAVLPTLIPLGVLGGYLRLFAAGVCLTGVGMGAVVFYASCQAMIHHAVPDELRGRIMGVWMIVYSGSVPLGCLWAGETALAFGAGPVMLASAVLCGASAAAVSGLKLLKARDLAATPNPLNAPQTIGDKPLRP